jgi:hypothetical protein
MSIWEYKVKDYIYSHIRWKLTEFRKIGNLKLNISLFRILIMPLYRLASAYFHRLSTAAKAKVEVKIIVQFKLFCNLQVNLSDVTFEKLFGGSFGDILLQTNKKLAFNLQERTRQWLAIRANEAKAAQASGQQMSEGMRYNHWERMLRKPTQELQNKRSSRKN